MLDELFFDEPPLDRPPDELRAERPAELLEDDDRPEEDDELFELLLARDDDPLLAAPFDLPLPFDEPLLLLPEDFDEVLLREELPLLLPDDADDLPPDDLPEDDLPPDDFVFVPPRDERDELEVLPLPPVDVTDSAAAPTAPTAAPVIAPPNMSPATSSTLSMTRVVVDRPDALPEPELLRDELLFF